MDVLLKNNQSIKPLPQEVKIKEIYNERFYNKPAGSRPYYVL